MLRHLLPLAIVVGLGACYSDADVGYAYGYDQGPALTYVSPGVEVVADYDYPVFFTDGAYWRFSGGYWYRSPRFDGGWSRTVYDYNVPGRLRSIRDPGRFAHYRAVPGRTRIVGRAVRDHRRY
jgi:hypothetical protein